MLLKRKFIALATILILHMTIQAQHPINWTEKQLEEPATLAQTLSDKKVVPVLISIGPAAIIPNSIDVGMVDNAEGLRKLEGELDSLIKEDKVVIYCGCCPFEHCPNVRPAVDLLKKKNFSNFYILNIRNNIRKDWIDKGYPVSK
jgi:thiosulfate/3-mercaptopyruvate sulfurtransferase